ncbi:YdcF family protein [Rhodospirillaceae bacterium SYSU D60014]|uniref:YdcF family protein n=1 Tax=Virgifigura deserti TaxID=2268457 RepID=UPI000E662681
MSRRAVLSSRSRRTNRRRFHRRLQLGAAGLLLLLLWAGGLVLFVGSIPQEVESPASSTDAIVVLTGGSGRLEEGLRLIAADRGRKLFISGVYQGVDLVELLDSMKQTADNVPTVEQVACCVVLGHSADDTEGNARETAEWMAEENFRSLRLVTAGYHMPRSLLEFRRVMPDLAIQPHPVFPAQVNQEAWWRSQGTALLMLKEYNKYLVALARSLITRPSTVYLHEM